VRVREFVEGYENSSFTRPSGGAFGVKLAQNSKNEKVVCGSLLEYHRHRISSLIKRWTSEQTKAYDDDDDTAMLYLACYNSRMIPVPTI
jgi:hypothetical protein